MIRALFTAALKTENDRLFYRRSFFNICKKTLASYDQKRYNNKAEPVRESSWIFEN